MGNINITNSWLKKYADRIDDANDEGPTTEQFNKPTSHDYWIRLKEGWNNPCNPGCTIIHEGTQKSVLTELKQCKLDEKELDYSKLYFGRER